MEESLNLDKKVDLWTDHLKSNPSFTETDTEELKSHLYDLIDALREKGLNDEEAFLIAKKRLGENYEVDEGFAEVNRPIIQMRRSLLILAGVLAYFMLYYFILFTSKILIISLRLTEVTKIETIEWVSRYLLTWHFLIVVFFASLYFLENKIIGFIEKLKLKPKGTIYLLAVTSLFAIIDTCLYPIAKNILEKDLIILSNLYQFYNYFDFSFPFLIGLSFIFIYYKYYKTTKF